MAKGALVELLELGDTATIEKLRLDYPLNSSLLSTARTLGTKAVNEKNLGRAPALIALITAGCKELSDKIELIISYVLHRMRLVWRTKFFGGIMATMSGVVTALSAVLGLSGTTSTLILSIFALVGGLVTLFADYFERAPSGIRVAGSEDHAKVVGIRAEVDRIQRQIGRVDVLPLGEVELEKILGTLDDYATEIKRLTYRS